MKNPLFTILLLFLSLLVSGSTFAQRIPAFPGAEGAGRFAEGGRGGDVYYVTNLDDSGSGSLRYGIETASGPRTIVFDVAGIIYLQDRLSVQDKSNLTIAGQTAPGGGLTLAHRSFFVSGSNDVIIQNIRFASGDGLTKSGTEHLPGHKANGSPRSIRIWNSNKVILDNVTARWGQEDSMGVSHGSQNVTIQNSFAAEGLHHADHSKGERGYAMVINGQHLSFMGNLLTQHRSRNPRTGLDGTHFEWHNNMMYHARDALLSPTDDLQLNTAGNIAIAGPSTSGPRYMIDFGHSTPKIYSHDNFYCRDANQPINLSGTSAEIVGDPTEVDAPFAINSDYQPVSRRQAYIHILSRGGASFKRDLHDKRAVRDVVERSGFHIDRPEDVGGYGEIAPGNPAVSTARDGIPDWWKTEQGLDIEKSYHQELNADGYTYLEKYLHSLMKPTRIAAATEQAEIEATEWPRVEWPRTAIDSDYVMLKFDVSSIRPGSIADAWLELDGVPAGAKVLARDPMANANRWESRTSIDSRTYDPKPWRLGEFFSDGTFDSPNLAVFLNSTLMHYGDSEENDVVTLLIKTNAEPESLSGRLVFLGEDLTMAQPSLPTERERFESALAAAGLLGKEAEADTAPFGDGVSNLLKYAFNMDLGRPDSRRLERDAGHTAGLPTIEANENGSKLGLVIEFLRRREGDLAYRPLFSVDLTDWDDVNGSETAEPIDDEWERVIVTQSTEDRNADRMFGKVEVRLP